jgi:phage terminase small subunit
VVPEPLRGAFTCPKSVSNNPRALHYWNHTLANVHPDHLAPIDGPLLARYCLALAFADEATERLQETSMLVKAPNTGLPIQSPYLPVINRQTDIARKLAAELALPPAARSRTKSGDGGAALPAARESEFDAYLRARPS